MSLLRQVSWSSILTKLLFITKSKNQILEILYIRRSSTLFLYDIFYSLLRICCFKRKSNKWTTPTTIVEVRNFFGLITLYRKFCQGFSTIMALITNCLKKGEFVWSKFATTIEIIENLTNRAYPSLPSFDFPKAFEVDASSVNIDGTFSLKGHLE